MKRKPRQGSARTITNSWLRRAITKVGRSWRTMARCLLVSLITVAVGCSNLGEAKPSASLDARPMSVESEKIKAALAGLVEGARRGDCAVYLQHVAERPEHFYQQETHWCASIQDYPLRSFDLQVGALRPVEADRVVGKLTKTWQPAGRPMTQTVTYEAVFVRDEAGNYRYAGPNFVKAENGYLQIYAFPDQEQLAKDLLSAVTPMWQALASELDFATDRPVPIELYPDEQLLASTVGDFLSFVAGAYTAPGEGIKVVTTVLRAVAAGGEAERENKSIEDLRGVIAHELGHYLLHQVAGGAAVFKAGGYARSLPVWLDEGMAEALSAPYKVATDTLRRQELAQLVVRNELVPLSRLADPTAMASEDSWKVFAEGYGMVMYVGERFGLERRNAWVRAVASGRDVEAATTEELGVSFLQLEQDWRSALERN